MDTGAFLVLWVRPVGWTAPPFAVEPLHISVEDTARPFANHGHETHVIAHVAGPYAEAARVLRTFCLEPAQRAHAAPMSALPVDGPAAVRRLLARVGL
ncbi:MAG: hypothetical protein IT382_00495 [Deltaproteobacteria bacterium]|nr:hypothetical protein [Deltaproteobacteria bacterium]